METSRRACIVSSVIAVAGCVGTSDADVVVEFVGTAEQAPETIPEETRQSRDDGGRREVGNLWVVIEFEVIEGALDMEDVWFHSRVEGDDRYYDLDHATADLTDGVQSRGDIQEGGSGVALYQIPESTEMYAWNLEQMNQQVEAQQGEG